MRLRVSAESRARGVWQTARCRNQRQPPPPLLTMPQVLIDFEHPTALTEWVTVDDVVMGGVSSSRVRHDPEGFAVFEGTLSLENNGGFCALRSGVLTERPLAADSFLLDVCGDGKRYKFNVRTEGGVEGLTYQASFDAPAGAWTQVRLQVSDLMPTFRGREVRGMDPLDAFRISHLSVIISDRQEGAFSLALRSLQCET